MIKLKPKIIITAAFLLLVVFLLVFFVRRSSNKMRLINEIEIESVFASVYNPVTRQELLILVNQGNKLEYLELLSFETESLIRAVKQRLVLRSRDMSEEWRNKTTSKNNANILRSNLLFPTNVFAYLSQFQELTAAEEEVLREISEVWKKYDNYIIDNNLSSASVAYSYGAELFGSTSTPFTVDRVDIDRPDADLIARHASEFSQELISSSFLFNRFVRDYNSIGQIAIKVGNENVRLIESAEEIDRLFDILRQCKFSALHKSSKNYDASDLWLSFNSRETTEKKKLYFFEDPIIADAHQTYSCDPKLGEEILAWSGSLSISD